MLNERHLLLCQADFNLNCLREECEEKNSSFPTDASTSNVHIKSEKLHTLMGTFHVLFDIYKILGIEFHRHDSADFFSVCPTCSDSYLMKTE